MFNTRAIHLIILLFFLSLTPLSSHRDFKGVNHKEWTKEQSLRWLSDKISWISWLFRSFLSFIYLIINTVVQALMLVMATIFNLLHQFIKLIEFVGYCVRLVLQANYNFVSSCVTKIRAFLVNSYVLFKELVESTGKTFISLVKTILYFLHSLVFNMPKLFDLTAIGVKATLEIARSVTYKTNSTFHTFVSTIRAVVVLFGKSLMNTLKLAIELLYRSLLSCGQFFQFIGKNIISFAIQLCRNLRLLFEMIWTEIEKISSIIISYTMSSFHVGLQFVKAVFLTFYDIILSVLQAIGLFVRHCGRFIFNSLIALGRTINSAVKSIAVMGAQLISDVKASKLSAVSISCMTLVAALIWVIFKFDIFILGFGLLESLMQNVTLMWITANEEEKTDTDRNRQATDVINSSTSVSTSGNEELLRRQLEIERDKSLCVVCQDQMKKILLLPCRHMCICVMCANHLTSFVHWNRRVCPLCRTRIGSMVEVYS